MAGIYSRFAVLFMVDVVILRGLKVISKVFYAFNLVTTRAASETNKSTVHHRLVRWPEDFTGAEHSTLQQLRTLLMKKLDVEEIFYDQYTPSQSLVHLHDVFCW